MSKRCIVPACYFGPIDLYRAIAQHEVIMVDLGEHYERKSPRSRMHIVGANGKQTLSAQVNRTHAKTPMREMRLSFTENWRQEHWHAIKSAYGQSAFFIYYADEVEQIILSDELSLSTRNLASMKLMCAHIGLDKDWQLSEQYIQDHEATDYRGDLGKGSTQIQSFNAMAPYRQVFQERQGFQAHLNILDMLFNMGPESFALLNQ